ncbi:restriction endonuclease PLD domain-containing protein [Methylobacter psychrophilus]|uniref:restriction endonuclease PLD domain-containing protein n=1 Tax=Methylobacter psychrophilus TaxID=96941 RepID=UPI0021D4AD68|nr:restriction endonuclease PLD domain-containing protein [Methylobacter psychrophilus]
MGNQLHIRACKKTKLVNLLLKVQDKRRCYHLYLTSCYFTPESAKNIIGKLSESIRLTGVTVYIDRKTATLHGNKVLTRFCKNNSLEIELFAVNSAILFHSKAYALVSYDESNEIYCGSLVVGSANLTGNGLTSRGGNIECLLDTQDDEMLKEFVSQLDSLTLINLDDIDKFKPADRDTYAFKYALLQRGAFIHKWTDDLAQYFAVRYILNDSGKEKIGDPVFKDRGFNIDTATISKRYFHLDYKPPHLEDTKNLRKNYGIETFLGHWVPRSDLVSLLKEKGIEEFKTELFSAIDEQYLSIKQQINEDMEYFMSAGVVEKDDSSPIEIFDKKIQDLRDNEYKIMRIFSKYEVFDLPYDLQEKDKIESLFYDIISLCESRKKPNAAMRRFLDAYVNANLDKLDDEL